MKSIKTKILLLFVSLLLLLQAISFWSTYDSLRTKERIAIDSQLSKAKALFDSEFNRREFYLTSFAETVTNDYGLKSVFGEDQRSVAIALLNHGKRINADLAMVVTPAGIIELQLVNSYQHNQNKKVVRGAQQGQAFGFMPALKQGQLPPYYVIGEQLYQLHLSPLKSGPAIIGWAGFGYEISTPLAESFLTLTGLQADLILEQQNRWSLLGSSNPLANITSAKALINPTSSDVISLKQQYSAAGGANFYVLLHSSRDNLVAVIQQSWLQILLITILTLIISMVAAYLIADDITRPIKLLVKQAKRLAAGEYQKPVSVNDKTELGQLASEFNSMQEKVLNREQAIKHRLQHDPLTELPNRHWLASKLQDLTEQNSAPFALFHLNICRLKEVNDTLGHSAGDQLIKEAGKRLTALQSEHFLCHIGADEFVLILPNITRDTARDELNNIAMQMHEGCNYQDMHLQLQIRVGVALYPEHSQDPQILVQKADAALNHCRESRSHCYIYDPSTDTNTVERLSLINDLKKAIQSNQLILHYQPKFSFAANKITHVEALVRWQHPELGMIPPDSFIEIAEHTGQINPLTRWVFLEALSQSLAWKVQGIDINIAINISGENLKDESFYSFICQNIESKQLRAESFTLEVTESALVDDPETAIALLARFKERGFKLSIDDYGTGYSSLAQLKRLPVHELKIDKSFVQKLAIDADDAIIVKSTIELAHNMGLSVVAEGIEDLASLRWLEKANCNLAQGYFISRPKPANELYQLLAQESIEFAN
ncbi:EAL domain-containing protein [Agarivorans sp. 1_MG-2023]|uniref:bifunctional diguanylate cyclase/phosphodiesterase n=1 Tax=Agarivorans sp. 1_MG-2023 TaxID=3062634 RepID=UPI0026E40ADC|nr:EAL domain-containing protein [Agarivorans sp. 1_MG-2023]MDO6762423.1 EAL domain-containing protein [Agarivorans sp. 1_MG-2023]